MADLAFNIIFFGIFFFVLTMIQIAATKRFAGLKKVYGIFFIIRVIAYISLISADYLLFFFLPFDFIFTIVVAVISAFRVSGIIEQTNILGEMHCPNCNALVSMGDLFCGECGVKLSFNKVPATVEPMYLKSENEILEELIRESASKNNYDINALIPEIKKRKIIISVICGIISFILTSLIFFHISSIIVLLDVINIIVYFIIMKKFNTMKYLIKEVKTRPDENLDYIVSNVLSNVSTSNYSKYLYGSSILIGILIPLIIFSKPHFFYEYTKSGYYVRFYTTSFVSEKHITIPETHNGKKIIGIRGDVFKNLRKLESVTLPDTMEVIRGHAFDNDINLVSINLPNNLTYLGGGAFKNCRKLKSINIPQGIKEIHCNTFENTGIENIELPDTITNIGGSAFKDCEYLKTVKLPSSTTEIHGNTFENCVNLESIGIPSTVTRIGGHAFYNNTKLSSVSIKEDSRLVEIGSSAFRLCKNLSYIVLPKSTTIINERAFKESPTNIYYFGDPMYGKTIDKSKFKYDTFGYLRVGATQTIGEYHDEAICHNDKFILTNIDSYEEKVIYTMQYIGKNETKTFTLDKDNHYLYINDNLAVELDSKYSITNKNAISFDIYYN